MAAEPAGATPMSALRAGTEDSTTVSVRNGEVSSPDRVCESHTDQSERLRSSALAIEAGAPMIRGWGPRATIRGRNP